MIELDWQASTAAGANNGKVDWWIDGTQQTGVSGIDNDTRRIDRVRLGAVAGVDATTNGTTYFDAFESRRSTYIGPIAGGTVTTTITYQYDPLYRLTRADYSTGEYFTYTYDAVGNRLTQTICLGTPTCSPVNSTYAYDESNRLLSVNGTAYTWDNNGNLLNDGTNTYVYDAANRLTSVIGGGTTSTYAYNGLGDRVSQTVNSVTTNYVLDMNAGLTQVLSDGGNTYLYGAARPSGAMRIGELQAGGMAYHLGDALGSVRQLTDASGSVTLARNFEPYGKVLGGTGSGSTTFAFTGEQLDAGTGFTFLRARYYNGALGRFFQKDAFSGDVLQPQTFNKYRYALNNPILLTEPSGNCEGVCWTIILIIALASAACTSAPAPTATPTIIFNTPTSPPQPTLTALPSQLKTLQDIANKYQIGLPPGMRFDFADAPGFDLSKWSRERLDQWAANEALATTGLSETGLYLGFSIPVAGSYTINIPGKPTGPWADEAVYVTEAAFPYYNNDEISIAGIMVHEARHAWQEYVLEENVTVKHQDELISAYEDLKNADVTGTSYGQYLEYDSFKAQVSFLEAHGQPNLQALQDAKEGLTYAENLFTPSQEFAGYLKIWDKIWDELPNVRVP